MFCLLVKKRLRIIFTTYCEEGFGKGCYCCREFSGDASVRFSWAFYRPLFLSTNDHSHFRIWPSRYGGGRQWERPHALGVELWHRKSKKILHEFGSKKNETAYGFRLAKVSQYLYSSAIVTPQARNAWTKRHCISRSSFFLQTFCASLS